MTDFLENLRFVIPLLSILWGGFLFFAVLRPQGFFNSFLLMLALFSTLFSVAILFGKNAPTVLFIFAILTLLFLLVVPFAFIYNGIVMAKKESRSLANMMSLILGVIIAFGEIAFVFLFMTEFIKGITKPFYVFLFFVSSTVIYLSIIMLAFFVYIISMQLLPHRMNFNYVVIHGCGLLGGNRMSKILSNRCDTAIKIYNKCKKKPILIPSGGKGEDEELSEAEAIRDYLLAHGIPMDMIMMENMSKTTMENLQYSKQIVSGMDGKRKTALVTSNYHVYRCILLAKAIKWKHVVGIGAPVAKYFWPSAAIREFVAVFLKTAKLAWLVIGYILAVIIPTIVLLSGTIQ